jgi:nucleotide-binding universal stress UspA family protein
MQERGQPVPVLVEESRSAYLVVIGSRGHGVVGGTLLGSVSLHLAHHAACPLVVVRAAQQPSSRTIVVGVDGSAHSAGPVAFACERAARTGEEVALMYGWHLGDRPWAELYGPPDDRTVAHVKDAERLLQDAAATARDGWPDVELRTEQVPVRPARLLVDAAANASLVVVGDRGHGAFAGMLLGSVSQHVVLHAPCPVAIVRGGATGPSRAGRDRPEERS